MHSRPKWFLRCFSSPMLNLSKESLVESISICKKYKKGIAKISSSRALKIHTSGIFSGSWLSGAAAWCPGGNNRSRKGDRRGSRKPAVRATRPGDTQATTGRPSLPTVQSYH